jgi:ornithine cyclodeaminase/alanine dehydrogenase-like protein (mu-crystallin family)
MQDSSKTTIAGLSVSDGAFHIKAAALEFYRPFFAAKVNANFPLNRTHEGLPTIQGTIALCDAVNGYPLAVMDSIEITRLRTGAASAVAAKYLARSDSRVVTILGCGTQGRVQLRALTRVREPELVYVYDIEETRADQMAAEIKQDLAIETRAVRGSIEAAVRASDICITCTPSKQTLVHKEWVKAGTFIAAVGADNEDKQEIDPQLMASSKVIVDVLDQCVGIGDLHHAISQGLMTRSHVHGNLGAVVSKRVAGREREDEIIVFDSTGCALEDVAAAALVYRKAVGSNRGLLIDFAN